MFRRIALIVILTLGILLVIGQTDVSSSNVNHLIEEGQNILERDKAAAFNNFEKAIHLLQRINQKDLSAESYFKIAEIISETDSISLVKNYYNQSAVFFKQTDQPEKAINSYICLGNYLFDLSYFSEALKAYNDALLVSNKAKNPSQLIAINIGSGKVYTKQGNFTQALNNFVIALELSEKYKMDKERSEAWNQIGIIHWKEGKNKESLSAYKKALEIREQLNDSLGIAESYNNIGIINKLEKNYSTAFALYQQSLEIRKKYNNRKGIAQTLFNIGSLKSETGFISEALDYYRQSFIIKHELKDEYGKLPCYLNIGDAYMQLNKMIDAENNFLQGLALSEKLGAGDYHQSFHRELAILFEKQKNFEKAYFHHVKYMALKDTLINTNNKSKLAELQAKYELSEKQRNIESLELERKLDRERSNREIYFRNSLIVIIILILFIVLIILNRSRVLRKNNFQLSAQKKIIEQRENEKEVLLKEMHHRVKNNLQLTSSLLNLQARKLTDKDAVQSLKQARDRIHAISLIHQKLYSKDEISKIDLSEYLPELCSAVVQSNTSEQKEINLNYNIVPIFVSVDMAISIGLIINETLINSLKHAFEKTENGNIKITCSVTESILFLSITDNGSGIPNLEDHENFGGFGFQLLQAFTKKLSGKITFENYNGTVINIQIPL